MAVVAQLPFCALPGTYENISSLAAEYTAAVGAMFTPFAIEMQDDQWHLETDIDILTPACAVPKLFSNPDTAILRFANEISALCRCVPTTSQGGLYSHLLSLCRQHAEQRNNPNDIYSVWTPTQHLELSEAQAWSVGYSVHVVRFLHELARAVETVGTGQDEDMALHDSSDPVKV